jgi:hypothetical protein
MNLQNVPMNLQIFITAKTKERNLTSCENPKKNLYKKSSVTHIPRVFVKTMHQSRQIFVELKTLPYLNNTFQQDANV